MREICRYYQSQTEPNYKTLITARRLLRVYSLEICLIRWELNSSLSDILSLPRSYSTESIFQVKMAWRIYILRHPPKAKQRRRSQGTIDYILHTWENPLNIRFRSLNRANQWINFYYAHSVLRMPNVELIVFSFVLTQKCHLTSEHSLNNSIFRVLLYLQCTSITVSWFRDTKRIVARQTLLRSFRFHFQFYFLMSSVLRYSIAL